MSKETETKPDTTEDSKRRGDSVQRVVSPEEKSIAELPTKLELGGLTVETAEQVGNQITIKFTNSKKIVIDAVPDWWSCDLYVTDLIPS